MDKKIAGLVGAVAALTSLDAAQAAAAPAPETNALHVNSYAELLNPVHNAVAALIADDATRGQKSSTDGVQLARHHHHHHHRYHRRYRRHHHHHHHSMYMRIPRSVG
jgi:hypothetical protein